MKGKYGATAKTVAENIAYLRGQVSYTELSERLATAGWPLTPATLRQMESCERAVTVDDLVALAVALNVSPATLLMPGVRRAGRDDPVAITGPDPADPTHRFPARKVWEWLSAQFFVGELDLLSFGSRAWPRWIRDEVQRQLGEEAQWTHEAIDRLEDQLLGCEEDETDGES